MTVYRSIPPNWISIHIKWSKTDQFPKGATVMMGLPYQVLCPVPALLKYMARWGKEGQLFRFRNGCPLTRVRFDAPLRRHYRG